MSTQAMTVTNDINFKPARRVNQALTASLEKRALEWMASRAPRWLTSDQLTVLGLSAQVGAGICYAVAGHYRLHCSW